MVLPALCPACAAVVSVEDFPLHWERCKPRHWSRRGDLPRPAGPLAEPTAAEVAQLTALVGRSAEAAKASQRASATIAAFLAAVLRSRFDGLCRPGESELRVRPCGPVTWGVVPSSRRMTYRFEAAVAVVDRQLVTTFARHLEGIVPCDIAVRGNTVIVEPRAPLLAQASRSSEAAVWSLVVQQAPVITQEVLRENCGPAADVALDSDGNFTLQFCSEGEMLDVLARGSLPLLSRGKHSFALLRGMSLETQSCSAVAQSCIVLHFEPTWEHPLSRQISAATAFHPNVSATILCLWLWFRTEVLFVRPRKIALSGYTISVMVLYALFRTETIEWPSPHQHSREQEAGAGDSSEVPPWKIKGVLGMCRRVLDFYGSPGDGEHEDALAHSDPFAWDKGEVVQLVTPVRMYSAAAEQRTGVIQEPAPPSPQPLPKLRVVCCGPPRASGVADLAAEWPAAHTQRLRSILFRGRLAFYSGGLWTQLCRHDTSAAEIAEGACARCGSSDVLSTERRGLRTHCVACSAAASSAGVVREALVAMSRDGNLPLFAALTDLMVDS
jgi:hypothetical protein